MRLRAPLTVVRWLRRNLFSSPLNVALTLAAAWLLYAALPPLIEWAVVDAGTAKSDVPFFEPRDTDRALDVARREIPAYMAGAAELSVPLVTDVGVGTNWDEAH